MSLRTVKSMFFCCSPKYMSAKVFGTKHPCLAQARATIPVISHALVAMRARSIALNLFSQGAF